MSLSIYDAAIPGFLQMLRNLSAMLDKAEAHAKAEGVALSTYTEARLAPDMRTFTQQIQMASDAAKDGAAKLAGLEAPSFPDDEQSFDDLRARLGKTIAFVESVGRDQVEGAEDRIIEVKAPGRSLTFTGAEYLFQLSLANFLFHTTTAYGLLRNKGVPLGKMDFLIGPVLSGAARA